MVEHVTTTFLTEDELTPINSWFIVKHTYDYRCLSLLRAASEISEKNVVTNGSEE